MTAMQKNLRILVIEDNPGDFVLIQEYLTEGMESPEIDRADTFSEAKKKLTNSTQYDSILLDLSLPDVSGEELVKKIISLAGNTPVVVLTGFENQEFGLKTLSWGVSDYLLKDESNSFVLTKVVTYSIERNRIQKTVKTSEKKYRDFFNLSPIPMWVYELETLRFLDVNQAAIDQYGYSREEFLNMTIEEIRPKEEISTLWEIIEYTKENDLSVWEGEVKHQKKDKTVFDVLIKSILIDHNGREGELIVAEDITEQKYYNHLEKLERDILEKNSLNELNIKELVEEFVLGIENLHPGTRCSVTKIVNNKLNEFASPSLPGEFLKMLNGVEIGPNAGSCGTAAFRKELVISENIFKDPLWKNYRSLGEKFNFSACWSQPVFNNKGDVVATFAVYYERPNKPSDLEINTVERAAHILRILFEGHEKEIAEEKLALSESKYKAIVQDGAELIAILDEEGVYNYVSPNTLEVMGIPPDEFIGENVFPYLHDDDRERIEKLLGTLDKGERKQIKPYRFKLKDYKEFWIETTVTNLLDNPSINGYLANSRNVTEQIEREHKLKELSLVASKSTDIVIITDEEGYITWVNKAFEELTEYMLDEAVGRKPGTLLQGPDSDPEMAEKLSEAVHNHQSIDTTILNYSKSGDEYWINMSIDPIFDDEGNCTHFIAIERDVTKEIEKEKELKESLERYDIVSKATSDTIWDLNLENDQMVYNSNIYTMFGYKEQEVKNIGSWWRDKIHPEDLEKVERALASVLKKGTERFQMEYRFKTADDTYKYILDRAFALKDEEGKPVRIIGAMQDITRQREEEERLKLYESVVTNTQEAVVIMEAEPSELPGRKILYVNEAFTEMTGYEKEEVLGKTPSFLNGPKTDQSLREKLRHSMNKYETVEVEFINYKKSGEEFWINISMVPVTNNKGNYTHWVSIGRDVTARRNYEEEIQTSLAEKEMLLSEIHHRVKNNLAVISGMMQLQAFESTNPELQEKLFDSVFRIKTMATVHELLYQTNSFSNIDFTKALTSLAKNVSDTLESDSNVEMKINSMPIRLNINQAIPVSLIVNEVITNAYKHAFDKQKTGLIEIDLQEKDDQVELHISDNGVGLPEHFDKNDLSSMGLKLINVLSEQVGASFDYNGLERGTQFSIFFEKAEIKGTGNVHMV
ncbi:MAG: PAS domain S-box protein [Balneolaceae bacterium]|nr:PAS domain S-box protein [Balneolaceae bacterium]